MRFASLTGNWVVKGRRPDVVGALNVQEIGSVGEYGLIVPIEP